MDEQNKDWLSESEIIMNFGNVTINGVRIKDEKNTTLIKEGKK